MNLSNKVMVGETAKLCLLISLTLGSVLGDGACERGKSWWHPEKGACVPCTKCDPRRLAVKYPCEVHRDTICQPLYEVRIWPFNAQKDSNDSSSDYEYYEYTDYSEVSGAESKELEWDLQTSTLTVAISGCIVFFVVVLTLSLYHAKQWRVLKQALKSDVRDLSAKLRLMETGVPAPSAPPPADHIYCNIHIAKEALLALPELWQISNPDYKNRAKKAAAAESLTEQFNTSASEINRKLHNLRTQFNNELRKLKKKKSGQGTDENYLSTWEYFTSLQFLMPSTVPANETQQNLNSPTNSENLESTDSQNSNTLSHSQRTSKKRKKKDEALERALSVLDKSDDAGVFGDFVAAAMRNMRSESRKRELKRKIQRIIIDIEELDEAEQYSRPSTSQSTSLPNVTWESSEDTNLTYENL